MSRSTVRRNLHYATGEDFWTLCRTYWADAVDVTPVIGHVTCARCLLKWEEQRTYPPPAD